MKQVQSGMHDLMQVLETMGSPDHGGSSWVEANARRIHVSQVFYGGLSLWIGCFRQA